MKRFFTLLIAVFLAANVFAQAPQKMSYQAVIRDGDDALVTNKQVGMRISILQGSSSGMAVYVETQSPTTNANGLISVEIGDGTVASGDITAIDWANGPYFIKTETDPSSDADYTITGTSQLLSVPYALHAQSAQALAGDIEENDPVFTAWDKSTGISISESQIMDLGEYLTTETDPAVAAIFDFTGAATGDLLRFNGTKWVKVTPDYISDYTVTESDVTAHQAALAITESQISDLGTYIETETQNLDDVLTQGTSAGNKNITNLADPVNDKDAVTKAYVDAILSRLSATGAVVTDADGNIYPTVRLGSQIWMAENLKTTKYSNGDLIGTTTLDISGETSPKYQWAYDGNESNVAVYGRLYTWYAVTDSRNICPTGWHVSTLEEWTAMEDYLIANGFNYDGTTSENKIAKALASTSGWEESIFTGAPGNTDYPVKRNASGFTALPGGVRFFEELYHGIGYEAYFWTTTESDGLTWFRWFCCDFAMLDGAGGDKKHGLSVRCIRD